MLGRAFSPRSVWRTVSRGVAPRTRGVAPGWGGTRRWRGRRCPTTIATVDRLDGVGCRTGNNGRSDSQIFRGEALDLSQPGASPQELGWRNPQGRRPGPIPAWAIAPGPTARPIIRAAWYDANDRT